ncbi:hypothetical protein PAPYR_8887 [Paratrimastix pyriformis]|uniref:CN hydrolase domain-containing protein n=1 Tax=Paratrimastix pyriformis TaxID=342808 RepID=A0ABQ8U9Q8_9EUKA|nr:hypothetical protein PAPYR_8887 [Paratrimastix pyriformis]
MKAGVQLLLALGAGLGAVFNFAYANGSLTFLAILATVSIALMGSWWALLATFFSLTVGTTITVMPFGRMPFGLSVVLYAFTFDLVSYFIPALLAKACRRRGKTGIHPIVLIVFPCAVVGFSHVGSALLDLGQCGNLGLTAFRFRMLSQAVMPLVGMAGMTWVMSFAAVVIAWFASRPSTQDRKRVLPYLLAAVILLAVLIGTSEVIEMRETSGAREDRRPTFRVASVLFDTRYHFKEARHVHALEALIKPGPLPAVQRLAPANPAGAGRPLPNLFGGRYVPGPTNISWSDVDHSQYYAQDRLDEAFEATRAAAATGARLIVWSEAAADTFEMEGDEDLIAAAWNDPAHALAASKRAPTLITKYLLFRRASEFARTSRINLLVGFTDILVSRADPTVVLNFTNKVALFDTRGMLRLEYAKRHPVPFLEAVIAPGSTPFPVVTLPAADWLPAGIEPATYPDSDLRVGICICYDAMYPGDTAALGRQRPDVVISASWDWRALSPTNSKQVGIRAALENGFTMTRATAFGGVATFNPFGEQLAMTEYFSYPHRPGLPISPGSKTLANAPFFTVADLPTFAVPRLFPFIYPAFEIICLAVSLLTTGLVFWNPATPVKRAP